MGGFMDYCGSDDIWYNFTEVPPSYWPSDSLGKNLSDVF